MDKLTGTIVALYLVPVAFVSEFGEDAGGRLSDPVSARFINARAHSDIAFDATRQLNQLFPFELEGQIAGIGVLIGNLLDQRRIVPGLQVCADLAGARAMQVADELECFGRAADRKMEAE